MLDVWVSELGLNTIAVAFLVRSPQNWVRACKASPSVKKYFALPWSVRFPQVKMPLSVITVGAGEAVFVAVGSIVLYVQVEPVFVCRMTPPVVRTSVQYEAGGRVGKLVL